MPTIYPNLLGHQPSDTTTPLGQRESEERNLEQASDKPKLSALKDQLSEVQDDASRHLSRIRNASDWMNSRWEGQTIDGLRWNTAGQPIDSVWPWAGASDTRTHIVSKVVGQHETVGGYALRNMKIQAKSSRPFASMKESQQATILLNWMIGTHMQMEAHRESRLALNWRNAFGSSVMAVDWEQERRIDYIQVSLMTLPALAEAQGLAGMGLAQELQGAGLMQWQSMIADESNEDALIPFVQKFSPILTKGQARKIIRDLRDMKYAEVPVPYIYLSKPRWRAMRPMIDVFFPADCDELNLRPRFVMEPERLTETELTDRIETHGYDPGFVREAIEHKGDMSDGPWTNRTLLGNYDRTDSDEENKIEIWRAKYKALDRGTPVLFDTVFHMNVDREAMHGPCQYKHGEFGYHDLRFERRDRSILSSKGIAEYAYTWQNEIKAQRDGRTDRVALALRPPIFAPYRDILRLKQQYMPGALIPESREGNVRKDLPPQWDPGSIEIEQTIMAAIDDHFGLFGMKVDLVLKQQRTAELADNLLMEFKPILRQTYQLMQDYLPDEEVTKVVGPLSRPFRVSRDEIQGQYEITATVDMREIDQEFLDKILNVAVQTTSLDTTGSIDRNKLVRFIMEKASPDFASELVGEQGPTTEKEIADERHDISLIIASGVDQPLPMGSNYQLRLQTMQNMMQELRQNPAATKTVQNNPEVLKVLMNRQQFFERQIQQQKNGQIGRTQVTQTFSEDAPQLADSSHQ